jgi:hypothetical protein
MSSQQQQQTQSMWTNSLFIPKIDFSVTKNDIKQIMEEYFGKVTRIDFVSFNSENGSGRRAFIHFSEWYMNDYSKFVKYSIDTKGYYDMLLPINGANPNNNSSVAKYTVRLLINKNPVPETEQTIQQVASNIDFMAEKIRIQEEQIEGLRQTCENLVFYTKQLELRLNATMMLQPLPSLPLHNIILSEEDQMGEMELSELN